MASGGRNSKRVCWVMAETALIAAFSVMRVALGATNPSDVQALQSMYTSMNNPSQLTGWKSSGGDPCGEAWKGITCEGPAVVAIRLSGLGLSGNIGYLLSNLISVTTLDVSANSIGGSIPYQLPPNVTMLNLSGNNLTGGLPYSISAMTSLNYLNISRNSLSESLVDMFSNLLNVASMDFSFNNFSGDLPNSFSSLSNLSTLYLQNNQFTGSLNTLANLPLTTLNVARNRFTGWIPKELTSIPNFIYDGNSFDNGPAPPPPPYTPPPPGRRPTHPNTPGSGSPPSSGGKSSSGNGNEGLGTGAKIGIIVGSSIILLGVIAAFIFCIRSKKKNGGVGGSSGSVVSSSGMQEHRGNSVTSLSDQKIPPGDLLMVDRVTGRNGSMSKSRSPIKATPYTVASLQSATNSFSQEYLIGEGSVGRVYRAEFSSGKVMAVKKIDNAALSLQEEGDFMEAVSNMSRLRHPNIVSMAGYCAEHGQHLLVSEYITNGNLHDMLHFVDDSSKALSWNARVKVALGTARALEYLHEVCMPPVVHRNLKSANILLDGEFNPHLSDCGVAALTPNPERTVSAQMVGSFGYSAPEFALSGIYTVKSDVYSFGVVMLELLTGRKPLDSSRARSEQSLVRWATPQLHDIDALAKMVDPTLNGIYPAKSLSRFADVIALCVQPEPEFRPPMSEVVQALVRLMQRASVVKRRSSDDAGFGYKTPDYEALEMAY
uniref:Protein kinase domain-containing protein n=1 Tax=Kalanchoe fedtschenkoi TaxID=63787 RepID=A0A7N0UIY9_KALFE